MALAVTIGTDLLSRFLSGADRRQQAALEEEAYRLYGDASPPTLERVLQERLGPSAMEAIPKDFGNRDARNLALQQLMEIGAAGGMDPGALLANEQARRMAAAQSASSNAAIAQDAQRRGLGGAGVATLQQQGQQQAANTAALGGLQAAASARARALEALSTGGQMAAQAEGQDFERAARIAESQDAIARFNANLATNAIQQDWQNRLGLMDRQYGATREYAGFKGGKAQDTMRRVGAYGQAANDAIAQAAGQMGGFGAGPRMFGGPVGPSQQYEPTPVEQATTKKRGR